MNRFYSLLFTTALLLFPQFSSAQHETHIMNDGIIPDNLYTNKVINSGNWSNPSTWEGGKIPELSSIVYIPNGFTVNYNVNSSQHIFAINNNGTMNFKPQGSDKLKLTVDTWVNGTNSSINMNASQNPNAKIEIVFTPFDIEKKKRGEIQGILWNNAIKSHFSDGFTVPIYDGEIKQDGIGVLGRYNWDPEQLSLGIISMGAVTIEGSDKTDFLQLDKTYLKREEKITLPNTVNGWKVGDDVFITGTNSLSASDTKKITAINGDIITLDTGLRYDHKVIAGFNFYAHIGNLTRNIVFRSSNSHVENLTRRGHCMFMHNPDVKIQHTQFKDLGRTDKSILLDDFQFTIDGFNEKDSKIVLPKNNDGTIKYLPAIPKEIFNQRGRYPFHFHRTFVTGTKAAIAVGNAIWGSPGWGMVHHDGNANFIDNVVYQGGGCGMVAESGSEMGTWKDNLVAWPSRYGMSKSWKGGSLGTQIRDVLDDDFTSSTAYGLQGRGVRMVGNISADASQAYEYQGSGTKRINNPIIDLVNTKLLSETLGFDMFPIRELVPRTEITIPEFRDNIAYNCKDGFKSQFRNETAHTMFNADANNFTVLNSRRFGIYFTSNFGYNFRNTVVHAHATQSNGNGIKTGLLILSSVDNINFSNVKFYGWEKPFRNGKDQPGNGNHKENAQFLFHNVTFQKSPSEPATYPQNPYQQWGNSNIPEIINGNANNQYEFIESGDKLDKEINVNTGDFKVTVSGEVIDRAGKRTFGNYANIISTHRDYNFNNDDKLKEYLGKTSSDNDPNNDPSIDSNGNGFGYIIEYTRDRIDASINKHYFKFNIKGTGYRPCQDNRPGLVKLFDDCNFSGVCSTFEEGIYTISDFTAKFPNDKLSSIIIPNNYKVTLYKHNLSGDELVLTSDNNCLNNFNNTTSSIKIERIVRPCEDNSENLVNVFDECNYSGVCASFEEGIYDFAAFTAKFPNDKLSSISIPLEYTVTLYQHDLSGQTLVLTNNNNCLNNFSNSASSIKIERNTLNTLNYQDNPVHIYPNPTTGIINITNLLSRLHAVDQAVIYDLRGSVVKTKKIINESEQFDISELSSGLYFISLQGHFNGTKKVISTLKIIKK